MEEFDITKHILVPEHTKLSDEEKEELLKELNISIKQLPRILSSDAAIKSIEIKQGDIIKIKRKSFVTKKEIEFYRVVVSG